MIGLSPIDYYHLYGHTFAPEIQEQFEALLREKEELEKRLEAMRKALYEIMIN